MASPIDARERDLSQRAEEPFISPPVSISLKVGIDPVSP